MSKRSSASENETLKKQKVEDFGDFWDDDLDGSLIDDCFERATQEVSKGRTDVTILPSYSFFKETNKVVFTSTQVSQLDSNIECKLKELQDKCAEKEGEVCILRANLQNLRTSCQLEQEKKDNEWKNKINATQKENKTIKSELEFKNLEIANLKQQIFELSRCVNIEQTTQNMKPTDNKTATNQNEAVMKDFAGQNPEIQINSGKCYPLKHIDFSYIFKLDLEENNYMKTKYNLHKGTISYLQNHTSQDNNLSVDAVEEAVFVGRKDLNLNSIYPELVHLISLSGDEIDSAAELQTINKVIDLFLQLLIEVHSYLKQIEDRIQVQDVQESDSLYLQGNDFNTLDHNCDNNLDELGSKAGKLVGFLAEIFPFNTYLQKCILQDTPPSSEYAKLLESRPKFQYLSLILDIVTAVGRTRKERVCSTFLSSAIKLLAKIYDYGDFSEAKDLVCEITKETLFLRIDIAVIFDIIILLQAASKTSVFINCICFKLTKATSDDNKAPKGILYFNRESCRFHMFVMLLENILPQIENEKILLNISSNILNVVFNIFQMNDPWLYQQENKGCICLYQLYKLGISIIYRNLKMFQERSKPSLYVDFFKKSINILSLLIFNSCEPTQKYVTNFAQFKEIVYTLSELHNEIGLDEHDVTTLEKLNIGEDDLEIPSDKFVGLEL